MRGLLIFTSLLASVAALRAPATVPPTGRAVVGRRFVLSAALLAPSAATAASLSSQLAGATGLAAQLEAGQKAPKAAAAYMGNEADARFAEVVAADLIAKEKKFGFALDQEDKDTFELILRNKYCGPQGLSSGWGLPGGPCEASNGCDNKMYGGPGCADRKKKK